MANNNDKAEEKDDIMDKIAQMQMDEILLDKAFNNSYLVLSGQITFEELLGRNFKKEESMILAFDPDCGPKESLAQNMIDHYIDQENYERCAKLKIIFDKTFSTTIE